MNPLHDTLTEVTAMLSRASAEVLRAGEIRGLSETEVLAVMTTVAEGMRHFEALMIECAGEVAAKSATTVREDRMCTRFGCASANELIQRSTRVSSRTAGEYLRVSSTVRERSALTTGELLPPVLPALREAMIDGHVGVDGLLAASKPLREMADRVPAEKLQFADAALAAIARGTGVDGSPHATAAELEMHAQAFAVFLDEDGAEPREAVAMRRRGLTLGLSRDGLIPVSGRLLPEVAAGLEHVFDSILNPKADGAGAGAGVGVATDSVGAMTSVTSSTGPRFIEDLAGPERRISGGAEPYDKTADQGAADARSRAQKLHDAFATLVTVAARSGQLPTIGGSAPTLVVSVRAEDLKSTTGYAHIDGSTEPISLAFARQIACEGGIHRVGQDTNGRIVSLRTDERVFNHHQRKAITLRDGGCVIPGCTVRAQWCEIHHVQEHARGGPTHTGNGVLLCWHHHRTLDTGGWEVRMRDGIPEVRGPAWWDAYRRWRPSTKSRIRLLNHHEPPPDRPHRS